MKLLITGAEGMLGHALSNVFFNHESLLTDRATLDITDPEAITDVFDRFAPHAVINAAGYTAVDLCEDPSNHAVATLLNATAVGYLAKAAAVRDIPLVHFGTDYVFDGNRQEGYDEFCTDFAPVNIYGQTKLAGEQELQNNTDKFYLIRTQWLYGMHGNNFVDTMLELGKEKKEIAVVDDQYGSPTWTHDLAMRAKMLLEKRYPFGVYHGVNAGTTTWFNFAKKIFEFVQADVVVTPVTTDAFPRPAKRPRYSQLLNTKLPLMRTWEVALGEYLKEKK